MAILHIDTSPAEVVLTTVGHATQEMVLEHESAHPELLVNSLECVSQHSRFSA